MFRRVWLWQYDEVFFHLYIFSLRFCSTWRNHFSFPFTQHVSGVSMMIKSVVSTRKVYFAWNLPMLLNYVTIIRLNALFLFILCNLTIYTHFLPLKPFSSEEQASRGAMCMTTNQWYMWTRNFGKFRREKSRTVAQPKENSSKPHAATIWFYF